MIWNGLRNEREVKQVRSITIQASHIHTRSLCNLTGARELKGQIANPFFPECCQNCTEQLWIESWLIFLLWNVFKMLIYTSRLNNHHHSGTIYNEPLCNVNMSMEEMYKYDTFRDQRVCIYFHFNYSFIADMEQCCHAAETHIPDKFRSERKLMCQLLTHKWNTLLHIMWSFLYTFLINWILYYEIVTCQEMRCHQRSHFHLLIYFLVIFFVSIILCMRMQRPCM